jgi:hypothetical protein
VGVGDFPLSDPSRMRPRAEMAMRMSSVIPSSSSILSTPCSRLTTAARGPVVTSLSGTA